MKRFFSISALCAAMFCLVLTGCKSKPEIKQFTVTFDSQGGSAVASITVVDGEKITQPADPTKADFVFAGWYKEQAWTNAWDFAKDVVTSDITLYAKWTAGSVNTEVVSLAFLDYYGDYAGTGTENFYTGFRTNAGVYYIIDLYSPSIITIGDGIAPAAGTYNYDVNTTGNAFTVGAEDSSISDGENSIGSFTSGTVKLTKVGNDYKVEGNLISNTGTTIAFIYQGEFIVIEPSIYDDEPTTTVNATINLNVLMGIKNYTDWYGVGENLYVGVTNANQDAAAIVDFIASGSGLTSVPATTYPINSSFGLNTVVAFVEEAVDMEGGSYIYYNGDYYFLISGSVVVTANGFILTGTSYNGSTFTVNYTGSLVVSPSSSGAPAKIAKKANFAKKSILSKGAKKLSLKK